MMLEVVQAFDRAPIAEIDPDDAAALERKLQAAERVFRDRDGWLKPHQRIGLVVGLVTAIVLFVADRYPDELREEKQEEPVFDPAKE